MNDLIGKLLSVLYALYVLLLIILMYREYSKYVLKYSITLITLYLLMVIMYVIVTFNSSVFVAVISFILGLSVFVLTYYILCKLEDMLGKYF